MSMVVGFHCVPILCCRMNACGGWSAATRSVELSCSVSSGQQATCPQVLFEWKRCLLRSTLERHCCIVRRWEIPGQGVAAGEGRARESRWRPLIQWRTMHHWMCEELRGRVRPLLTARDVRDPADFRRVPFDFRKAAVVPESLDLEMATRSPIYERAECRASPARFGSSSCAEGGLRSD